MHHGQSYLGSAQAVRGLIVLSCLSVCDAFVVVSNPRLLSQCYLPSPSTSWDRCFQSQASHHSSHRCLRPLFSTQSSDSERTDGVEQTHGSMKASVSARQGQQTHVRKSKAEQQSDMFDWLFEEAGLANKTVSLRAVKGSGNRGLVANDDVLQGEAMLEVPAETCLWSNRDGVVTGLYGQTDLCWEAAGDLRDPVSDDDFARGMTWDVRLALALLEATADPQVGGKFWSVYGRLLPQPHTVTVPFCLPERLLGQLHNDGMANRARKQVERLRSLYPDLMKTLLSHPQTLVYVPDAKPAVGERQEPAAPEVERDVAPLALVWAFAMVRSRAFASSDDRFAFVPFLDMANHAFTPSANFTYEEPGVFRLRAMRDMKAGEEATISYGESLNAEQLMVQYGFPVPSTVPLSHPLGDVDVLRDRAAASASTAAARNEEEDSSSINEEEAMEQQWGEGARRALMDELFMRGQQRFATEAGSNTQRFETLVRRAIPLIPVVATTVGELRGNGGAVEGAKAFLEELQAYRSKNFPTSEEQDKELLSFCLGDGKGKVDPRLADVVRYRIARKEAHSLAQSVLEEYLWPAPPPPSSASTVPQEPEIVGSEVNARAADSKEKNSPPPAESGA